MSQWENLPQSVPERRPVPATASWTGFGADPRIPANQPLRAADADRDFAAGLIEQARLDGRLDAAEAVERAARVAQSRTFGELAPLVSDLMVASAVTGAARPGPSRGARAGVTAWVGLAVLLNAIWLMTVLTAGHLLYYWPMWAMVGTGVPVLMATLWGSSAEAQQRREERREAHDQRHAVRHAQRAERRALRHGGTVGLPPASAPRQLPPAEEDLR